MLRVGQEHREPFSDLFACSSESKQGVKTGTELKLEIRAVDFPTELIKP